MVNQLINTQRMNLFMAEALVKDLTEEQMRAQPHGLVNHPCWSLGHLVVSGHNLCRLLSVASSPPEGWAETFGRLAKPDDARVDPSKDELLAELRRVHQVLADALTTIDPAALEAAHPKEEFRQYFPTVADNVLYLMTAHETNHLGQVAAWRRAMGLGPAM